MGVRGAGAEGRTYPWGETEPGPTLLNAAGGEPRRFLEERGIMGWATTSPVGSYPLGATRDTGLYDLAGNVWEWTESPQEAGDETLRVLPGSNWYGHVPSWVRASERNWLEAVYGYRFIGFRCALGDTSTSR